MAKTSSIQRNLKRTRLVAKYDAQRKELKAVIRSLTATQSQKEIAIRKLQALPRNASPVRIRNRCQLSGRSRGFVRRFGLSRIAFRDMALEGKIPGVRKASW
ncbi:MAG: 30S ribosomal protein S14 [Gemmatimonadales bacterium]